MSKNLFKVTYRKALPAEDRDPVTVFVVIPTWEDLVDYVHSCHGNIVSAESVNIGAGERVHVLVAPDSFCGK